jgi:hypothetical protein
MTGKLWVITVSIITVLLAGCGGGGGGGATGTTGGGTSPIDTTPVAKSVGIELDFASIFGSMNKVNSSKLSGSISRALLPGLNSIRLTIKLAGSSQVYLENTYTAEQTKATVNVELGNDYTILVEALNASNTVFASGAGDLSLTSTPSTERVQVTIPVAPVTPGIANSTVSPLSSTFTGDLPLWFHVIDNTSSSAAKIQVSTGDGPFIAYPRCNHDGNWPNWPTCDDPPPHFIDCNATTGECSLASVTTSQRNAGNGFSLLLSGNPGDSFTVKFTAEDSNGNIEPIHTEIYKVAVLAETKPSSDSVASSHVMTADGYQAAQLVPVGGRWVLSTDK